MSEPAVEAAENKWVRDPESYGPDTGIDDDQEIPPRIGYRPDEVGK